MPSTQKEEDLFMLQPSATDCGPYDYSRSGNPTRTLLEAQIKDLEGASRSFAFVSGMAALSTVLRTISTGDHIVAGDDLYGGTSRLLAQVAPNLGLNVTHIDTTNVEWVDPARRMTAPISTGKALKTPFDCEGIAIRGNATIRRLRHIPLLEW